MTAYRNTLLQRCDPETLARLQLHHVDLPVGREIEFPGQRIGNLFFLETGIASTTTTFDDGFQVEVALAGWEAVLGASSLIGTRRSLNRVYMQIAGHGFASELSAAAREFRRGERFHDLTLAYLQAQFIQCAQTAACNTRHTIEQRFARWLLLCADRIEDDVLPLKHEFIADMLGVTRSSVSLAAGNFQDRGLIRYSRGKLQLLDRPGLERLSCECYAVVRQHLTSYADLGEVAAPPPGRNQADPPQPQPLLTPPNQPPGSSSLKHLS